MRTQRKFLALLMAIIMMTNIIPTSAIAEEVEGTASNPYTLEGFNALTKSVSGDIYITLDTVDMNGADFTIGNEEYLADEYAGKLMSSQGTRDAETGEFTVTDTSITIIDKKVLENTKVDVNGIVSSIDYGGIGYYTEEKPVKPHLNLHIVGGTINTGVATNASDKVNNAVNDSSIPIIKVLVQDNADVTFENVTVNGCYSLAFGYQQTVPGGNNPTHKILHTLNSATFSNCTFNGVLLSGGGICTYGVNVRELAYDNCTFTDYDNGNNSNPIWIQHTRTLESVSIENCTVTSTRPIKFETPGSTVHASFNIANNTFNMLVGNTHTNDDADNVKNAALMFSDGTGVTFGSINISDNTLNTQDGIHQQLLALNKGQLSLTENEMLAFENNRDGNGDAISGTELVDEWKAAGTYTEALATLVNGSSVKGYVPTTATITDSTGFIRQYADLQDAVNAVEDGGTIEVLTDDQTAKVTTAKTFELTGDGAASAQIAVPAGYDVTKNESDNTYAVTVAKQPVTPITPSTPGTSSRDDDDDDGYSVSVPSSSSIKNGSITVSPRSAERGDTVTITVKPDEGYELDGLTVTDKDGKTVKVTEGKNGKYTFTMPASKVTVEAEFAKAEETPDQRFTDVPNGYWAEDEINWAAEKGYMNGNTATTFNPEGTVTRQQLWMILARLSGYRPADFNEAKAWAVDNSISDGTAPGNAVSRQQLVTILYRYAVRMGYQVSGTADLTAFPDHASVAAYAADAMSWSAASGIVGGTTAGTLNPAGTATRAQFAVILYRFCDKVVD